MTVQAHQRLFLTLLIVLIPLGFATKLYTGPGAGWIVGSLGGAFYVAFWMLAVVFAAPRASSAAVALWVFLATCMIELLQLWHPPLLEAIRSTFVGRTVLGDTFSWADFPYYALGAFAGYGLIESVRRHAPSAPL